MVERLQHFIRDNVRNIESANREIKKATINTTIQCNEITYRDVNIVQ